MEQHWVDVRARRESMSDSMSDGWKMMMMMMEALRYLRGWSIWDKQKIFEDAKIQISIFRCPAVWLDRDLMISNELHVVESLQNHWGLLFCVYYYRCNRQNVMNMIRIYQYLTMSLLKNSSCGAECLLLLSKQLTLRGLFLTSRAKLPARKHSRANDK